MTRLKGARSRPARPAHCRPRPLGAWLGIVALLFQLVVSALPMPAAAATGPDRDLTRLCSSHHIDGLPDQSPQSPLHHSHCPVCAAAHLGATTLPPPIGVFIGCDRVAMVAVTLHLTPELNKLATSKSFSFFNFISKAPCLPWKLDKSRDKNLAKHMEKAKLY